MTKNPLGEVREPAPEAEARPGLTAVPVNTTSSNPSLSASPKDEVLAIGMTNGAAADINSAEVDEHGRPYLEGQKWQKMSGDEGGGALDRLFVRLYGNLPMEERLRVAWLAGTLFFIIGGYWLLRSLKDPIVSAIVGVEYIPRCKITSLGVVFILVFLYNKLVDMFPKHQLFYIIGGFYFVLFMCISLLLADPVIGINNTNADPARLLGWVSYCAIESFGSICVSLFWAFVNSTLKLEAAKSAFGLIIAGANLGSILGPTIATTAPAVGVPLLYSVGATCMGLMVLMMWGYVKHFGVVVETSKSKKNGAGVLEGFNLFMKYDYIKGIFAMSCLFMVEVTILDYMMKKMAVEEFKSMYPDDEVVANRKFAAFTGLFGQVTNTISFTFSLLGTSMVIRRLGLKMTLLAFPVLCVAVVLMVMARSELYVVFLALILLKGFSYSLNNPCKEILYQPTSSAVKFKSKSWIDIFGARMSKAGGSLVTNAFSDSLTGLVQFGGLVALLGSTFLIWVAWIMGKMFDELILSEEIVGEEPKTYLLEELAAGQDEADTSCGVLEEGQGEEGGGEGSSMDSAKKNAVDN